MKPDKRRQIIDEISKYTKPPTLQPHEFTIRQYAEVHDLTISIAGSQLKRAFDEGLLERRKVNHQGKIKWAYQVAEGEEDAEEPGE